MNATDLPKQEDFYRHYLRGYDGKQRVIVIISDAFRYECAKELFGRLELDEKCTPKMECMLSCLPSVTSVGMASLLPHKEMQVDGSLNVTVGVSFLLALLFRTCGVLLCIHYIFLRTDCIILKNIACS